MERRHRVLASAVRSTTHRGGPSEDPSSGERCRLLPSSTRRGVNPKTSPFKGHCARPQQVRPIGPQFHLVSKPILSALQTTAS